MDSFSSQKQVEEEIDYERICSPCPIFHEGRIPTDDECAVCTFNDNDEEEEDTSPLF